MTEEECLKNIGDYKDYELNEKYQNIVADILKRICSNKNDKEDYFHNTSRIHFMMSPLSGVDKPFRIVDILLIITEAFHYLQETENKEPSK